GQTRIVEVSTLAPNDPNDPVLAGSGPNARPLVVTYNYDHENNEVLPNLVIDGGDYSDTVPPNDQNGNPVEEGNLTRCTRTVSGRTGSPGAAPSPRRPGPNTTATPRAAHWSSTRGTRALTAVTTCASTSIPTATRRSTATARSTTRPSWPRPAATTP